MDCIHLAEERGSLLYLENTIMNLGATLKGHFLVMCNYN
jgi:hypothetical protein